MTHARSVSVGHDPVSLQERPHVFQKHEQVERVGRRFLKAEPRVPRLRSLVLCMDEEQSRPDRVGCLDASKEHVLKQRSAEALALLALVDRESRQQDRRHGACSRLALERSGGRVLRGDLGRSECVVADNCLSILEGRDKDTRGVGGLCGVGAPFEPLVECRLTTLELVQAMLFAERLGAPVSHALFGREDARLREEPLKPRVLLRGAIEELDEAAPLFRLELEARPVGEQTLGFDHRSVDDEVGQRTVSGSGCLADELIRLRSDPEVPTLLSLRHGPTVHTPYVQRKSTRRLRGAEVAIARAAQAPRVRSLAGLMPPGGGQLDSPGG